MQKVEFRQHQHSLSLRSQCKLVSLVICDFDRVLEISARNFPLIGLMVLEKCLNRHFEGNLGFRQDVNRVKLHH